MSEEEEGDQNAEKAPDDLNEDEGPAALSSPTPYGSAEDDETIGKHAPKRSRSD